MKRKNCLVSVFVVPVLLSSASLSWAENNCAEAYNQNKNEYQYCCQNTTSNGGGWYSSKCSSSSPLVAKCTASNLGSNWQCVSHDDMYVCTGASTGSHGCSYTENGNDSQSTCSNFYVPASCQCSTSNTGEGGSTSGQYGTGTQCSWGSYCSNGGGECLDLDAPYQGTCSC